MKTIFYRLFTVFSLIFICLQANGADIKTVQNGEWFSALTWEDNKIPTVFDNTIINHSVTITEGLANFMVKCNHLTINYGGSLTLNNLIRLDVKGNFVNYGTLVTNDSTHLLIYGDFTNYGFFNASNNSARIGFTGNYHQEIDNSGTIILYIRNLFIDNKNGISITGTENIPVYKIELRSGQIKNSNNISLANNSIIQRGHSPDNQAGFFDVSPDFSNVSRYNLIYHSSLSQITTGFEYNSSKDLNSLTINNNDANGVKFDNDFVISEYGIVTMTNGKINLNGYSLTYGTYGALEYNGTTVQETADAEYPVMSGPSKMIINNPTTLTLHADRTIRDSLMLNLGTFDNNGIGNYLIFTLGNGATIVRTGGKFSSEPAFGRAVNIVYNQYSSPIITGYEIPVPGVSRIFNNVTLNNSNGIILGRDIYISGTLAMTQGSIELDGKNVLYGVNGTLLYNGIAAQITNDAEFPLTNGPKNLIISNTNGVTLNRDRNIIGEIGLFEGELITGDYLMILGDNGTTGTLSRVNGVIVGALRRYLQTSNLSYDFYIGPNISHALSVNLVFSGGLTNGGTVTVKWIDNIIHNGPGSFTEDGRIIDRVANGCWDIVSTLIDPSVEINVNADNYLGVIDAVNYTQLRILKRTNSSAPWELLGNHENAIQSGSYYIVKRTEISGFSQFVVAGASSDGNLLQGPLPVKLTSFISSVNGQNVHLKWTTMEEINNSGFDIERKNPDKEGWKKIAFVSGNGNKSTPTPYSYEDKNLSTGKYNYRLKQIDYNGNYEYFNLDGTVEVGIPAKYNLSQNYPNPFNPVTNINFEIPEAGFVNLKVYDLSGKETANIINEYKSAGYYTVNFNATGLSSGVYFYRLCVNGISFTKKMSVIK
ncbi:MAG: T9SS type A sorting domain-containing protein [Ignavibacteria bacterium]|nr:T9SS type A sorting domain-containing protein [Ignavibacteria bacterium]